MLKKALVTGSSTGIGKAIALDLASKGFDIAIHYNRSVEAANQVSQEAANYGVKSIAVQGDLTNPEQAESVVKQASEGLGGLSVVVNNVGNFLEKTTSQISIEEWHEMLDSNLNSTFYVTRTAIPDLKAAGGGRIVNFSFASAQHLKADDQQTAYRIAKTGIIIYSKSLAQELIKDKITVNVVAPGAAENTIGLEETIPMLPTRRAATLEEVSHAVGFFVSPESDYITGQVLEVAGGWRL